MYAGMKSEAVAAHGPSVIPVNPRNPLTEIGGLADMFKSLASARNLFGAAHSPDLKIIPHNITAIP